MPYCGLGAAYLFNNTTAVKKTRNPASVAADSPVPPSRRLKKSFAVLMLALQVPVILFFSLYHQRAQVQVMKALDLETPESISPSSVLFLTPCHTTPYYSYIHKAIPMRFLDCSPPGILNFCIKIKSAAFSFSLCDLLQNFEKKLTALFIFFPLVKDGMMLFTN